MREAKPLSTCDLSQRDPGQQSHRRKSKECASWNVLLKAKRGQAADGDHPRPATLCSGNRGGCFR
jgi:hypothetical protein